MNFDNESQEIYDQLYQNSIQQIQSGKIDIDRYLLDKQNDYRRGISLIIRPNAEVKNQIVKFQEELRAVDENQYYQPKTDLHITLLSVISAYDGFRLENIDAKHYSNIIRECLRDKSRNIVKFKGVTTSSGAVMIQGFDLQNKLNLMRENLRHAFNRSRLTDSIDVRYSIKTAHITAVRFMHSLKNSKDYSDIIKKYRDYDFHSFQASELEFVFNDWYQSKNTVKILEKFRIL